MMNGIVIGQVIGSLFLVAGCCASFIMMKGLLHFSRTGPGIKDEILKQYQWYSIVSFFRLFVFILLINLYLATIGFLTYVAILVITDGQYFVIASSLFSFFAIGLFTFIQFCKNLLYLPINIILSSQYSMKNFHALWQWLTPAKLFVIDLIPKLVFIITTLAAAVMLRKNAPEQSNILFLYPLLGVDVIFIWLMFPINFFTRLRGTGKKIKEKPNIIMIGSDTLREDRVGYKRDNTSITPTLDDLALRSVSFKNCYVPIARTAPSLLSFFSGVLPWRHQVRDNFSESAELSLDVTPLPEILKQSGYTTAVISDWCGTDLTKFDLGFSWKDLPEDQWNLRYFIRQGPKDIRLFLSLFLQNRLGRLILPEIFYLGGVPQGKYLLERSEQWISKLSNKTEPFFLNIFLGTTHPPFGSEYPYYSKYADRDYWGESKFAMSRLTNPDEIIRSQKEPKEAFDLSQIMDLYDGTVSNFDDQVARILDVIKKNEIEENTIVIIYSDHGMEFFENDTWGQGNSVFSDFSYKVPLIIYNPKWKQHKEVQQVIRSVDLLPTLLEVLGLDNNENYDGQSLLPIIENDAELNLDVLAETGIWFSKPPGMKEGHLHYPELLDLIDVSKKENGTIILKTGLKETIYKAKDSMLISGKWKLVKQPMDDGDCFQLFDRNKDPQNKYDISDSHKDVFVTMKKKLLDFYRHN